MTQEQLADRLGVSYQSISRWENSGTYPDMELIPSIAKIFSVSLDTLFDIPKIAKEEETRNTLDSLRREAMKKDFDVNTVNELIRDIRRNYIDTESMELFWTIGNDRCYSHPEILPEVRLTAEAYLEVSKNTLWKNQVIETMAVIEDDEHVREFLNKYAPEIDISQCALMLKRYEMRREWDKYEIDRKTALFGLMSKICDSRSSYFNVKHKATDPLYLSELYKFQLEILNRFCGYSLDQEFPISGNGKVDFWVQERLDIGFRYACCLAALNDRDAAFAVLKDCVLLLENIMQITDEIELSCSSVWLKDYIWHAEPIWSNLRNDPDGKEERCIWIHADDGYLYMVFPSVYYDMLVGPHEWGWGEWFEFICHDETYVQLAARVEKLVQHREKTN